MVKYIFIYCENLTASINVYSIDHILVFNEDILNPLVFNENYNNIVKSVWKDIEYLELIDVIYKNENSKLVFNINNIHCFKLVGHNDWEMINHPGIDKVRKGVIKLLMIQ